MNKIGIFKIEDSFNITGRGIVVTGYVIEKIPRLGNSISIIVNGKEDVFKIIGIESGKPDKNDIIRFGLLLSIDDRVQFNFIVQNKITEQMASIYET